MQVLECRGLPLAISLPGCAAWKARFGWLLFAQTYQEGSFLSFLQSLPYFELQSELHDRNCNTM